MLVTSFLSLLQSTKSADAQIPVYAYEEIKDSELGMSFIAAKSKSSAIQDASLAAVAAYNTKSDVAKKLTPLRKQMDYAVRDELGKNHKIVNFNATDPLRGAIPAGIITYKEDDSGRAQLIVAYHGSESLEDFTEANLRFHHRKNPDLGIEGNIHGGFHDRYMQSRSAMMHGIQKLLADQRKDIADVEFIITGHSLGGALATIAAADIKKNIAEKNHLDLITFSSPRVVSSQGAKSIESLLGDGHIFRIWRDHDPVTAILLNIFGYKHVGESTKLKSKTGYVHFSNHSLTAIKDDALSSNNVEILEHEGYRSWMKRNIRTAPQVAVGYIKSAASKIRGLFSRK